MATAQDYKFEGWQAHDASAADGNMRWEEFEPKPWEESDVDIRVTHCGMCGSDLHVLRSGWGATPYPLTVGHEIVGVVVRAGNQVMNGLKVGDRVGVGAQGDSCLSRFGDGARCDDCDANEENYCPKMVFTYSAPALHFNGGKAQGGYATYHRAPSHFVVKIPDNVDSAEAAPMLCGGVTVFAPLKFHDTKPGMSVGIVGVGGLGHYGVIFAKAMGADRVVGISRRENKRKEVLSLGADDYIATADDANWPAKNARSLDLIISTVASADVPIDDYFTLLKRDGKFVQVGIPEDGPFKLAAPSVVFGRQSFTGSMIGSPNDLREMLELVSKKNLKGMVQLRPMTEANEAIQDLEAGKPRYRYVLVNETA
ncbi:zinc-binding dehydrogenase [Apiospora arundinis]